MCPYGVTEKCKNVKKKIIILTLKINLSHAICNSRNEDTFSHVFSCYLYVNFFNIFAMLQHRTQSNFYLSIKIPVFLFTIGQSKWLWGSCTFPKTPENTWFCWRKLSKILVQERAVPSVHEVISQRRVRSSFGQAEDNLSHGVTPQCWCCLPYGQELYRNVGFSIMVSPWICETCWYWTNMCLS